jgi:hypothetical protein
MSENRLFRLKGPYHMKPQKPKLSTKRAKKSPIVSVVVEHNTPPSREGQMENALPQSTTPVPAVHEPKERRTEVVKTLASTLGETKPGVLSQLSVIVKRLGCEEALRLLVRAQEIEANGGMLINNGSRRRTPGGVFFALVHATHPDLGFRPKRPKKQTHHDRERTNP